MVKKRRSRGSLLGRSSSGSEDKTGIYLVSIVAVVAAVALFLMNTGGLSFGDSDSALAGQAFSTGDTCEFSSDCDAGSSCNELIGECVSHNSINDRGVCTNDIQCSSNRCDDDLYVCGCDSDSHCNPGRSCLISDKDGSVNLCIDEGSMAAGGFCNNNNQCASSLCVDPTGGRSDIGICGCDDNSDCGVGQTCLFSEAWCIDNGALLSGGKCSNNAQCYSGSCTGNLCD